MDQMISELGREDLYIFIFLLVGVVGAVIFCVVFFRGIMAKGKRENEAQSISGSPYSNRSQELDAKRLPQTEPIGVSEASDTVDHPAVPAKLASTLVNTRSSFFGRIKSLIGAKTILSRSEMEELEEILYTSDLGPQTVQKLLSAVDSQMHVSGGSLESVRSALKSEILEIFAQSSGVETTYSEAIKLAAATAPKSVPKNDRGDLFGGLYELIERTEKPVVIMIVGVNGAGKTTTIGKLASKFAKSGRKVLVAAGDTFRAAAGDQLKIWTDRARVEIFSPEGVSDPSAVAFKACELARAQGFEVVIIDTAGRLHTQVNLMEELKKMKRVITKQIPLAPHEILLVLDANSGQNALAQAREFKKALDVTGVVLTKLDGTAKGGVAVGLACELKLPIKLIGIGEGIDDLRQFSSQEFVDSIL